MNGIIYYIYNITSGKGYVGRHYKHDLLFRFNLHCKNNSPIGNAIRKHGKEFFKVVLLDTGSSDEELYEKEIYWIDRLETISPEGYNLNSGGQGTTGWNPEESSRLAMSIAKRGYKLPLEHRLAMSVARKGVPHSIEHSENISKALKGKPKSIEHKRANAFSQSRFTPEDIQHIRKSTKTTWELATEYQESYSTISAIRKYKSFRMEP